METPRRTLCEVAKETRDLAEQAVHKAEGVIRDHSTTQLFHCDKSQRNATIHRHLHTHVPLQKHHLDKPYKQNFAPFIMPKKKTTGMNIGHHPDPNDFYSVHDNCANKKLESPEIYAREAAQARGEDQGLKSQLRVLRNQCIGADRLTSTLLQRYQDSQIELERLRQELKKSETKTHMFCHTQRKLKSEKSADKSVHETLCARLVDSEKQITQLSRDLRDAHGVQRELSQDLLQTRELLDRAEIANENLRQLYERKCCEFGKCQSSLDQTTASLSQTKDKALQLENQLKQALASKSTLENAMADLHRENASLRCHIESFEQQQEDTTGDDTESERLHGKDFIELIPQQQKQQLPLQTLKHGKNQSFSSSKFSVRHPDEDRSRHGLPNQRHKNYHHHKKQETSDFSVTKKQEERKHVKVDVPSDALTDTVTSDAHKVFTENEAHQGDREQNQDNMPCAHASSAVPSNKEKDMTLNPDQLSASTVEELRAAVAELHEQQRVLLLEKEQILQDVDETASAMEASQQLLRQRLAETEMELQRERDRSKNLMLQLKKASLYNNSNLHGKGLTSLRSQQCSLNTQSSQSNVSDMSNEGENNRPDKDANNDSSKIDSRVILDHDLREEDDLMMNLSPSPSTLVWQARKEAQVLREALHEDYDLERAETELHRLEGLLECSIASEHVDSNSNALDSSQLGVTHHVSQSQGGTTPETSYQLGSHEEANIMRVGYMFEPRLPFDPQGGSKSASQFHRKLDNFLAMPLSNLFSVKACKEVEDICSVKDSGYESCTMQSSFLPTEAMTYFQDIHVALSQTSETDKSCSLLPSNPLESTRNTKIRTGGGKTYPKQGVREDEEMLRAVFGRSSPSHISIEKAQQTKLPANRPFMLWLIHALSIASWLLTLSKQQKKVIDHSSFKNLQTQTSSSHSNPLSVQIESTQKAGYGSNNAMAAALNHAQQQAASLAADLRLCQFEKRAMESRLARSQVSVSCKRCLNVLPRLKTTLANVMNKLLMLQERTSALSGDDLRELDRLLREC